MNLEYEHALFYFLSFSPGPFWLILVFFPHKKWAMTLYDCFLILLSLIFAVHTLPEIPRLDPIIASPTFEFKTSNEVFL